MANSQTLTGKLPVGRKEGRALSRLLPVRKIGQLVKKKRAAREICQMPDEGEKPEDGCL